MKQYKLKETNQKGKYFDIRRIIKAFNKYIIFLIMGDRGIGKSTTGYFHVIRDAIINDIKFFWIFQYAEEVKSKKSLFHKLVPTLKDKFKWFDGDIVVERNDIFYLRREEYITKTGQIRHRTLEKKHIGSVLGLSDYSNIRGNVYTGYGNGICEEYQLENGKYIPGYGKALLSVSETVLRTNPNARIFLFSNRIDPYCPLHVELGVKNTRELELNHFYLLSDTLTMILNLGTGAELKKDKDQSTIGRAFSKNKYYKYAHEGEWFDDVGSIPIKSFNGYDFLYNLVYNNSTYGVYLGPGFTFISERKRPSGKKYGATKQDCLKNQLNLEMSMAKIKSLLKRNSLNRLYFENELLYHVFLDIFKK